MIHFFFKCVVFHDCSQKQKREALCLTHSYSPHVFHLYETPLRHQARQTRTLGGESCTTIDMKREKQVTRLKEEQITRKKMKGNKVQEWKKRQMISTGRRILTGVNNFHRG